MFNDTPVDFGKIMAQRPVAERLKIIRDMPLFPIEPLNIIEQWLKSEIAKEGKSPKPLNVLTSPSGMGVSEMVKRIERAFCENTKTEDAILAHPVVSFHIPPAGGIRDIGAEVCAKLGFPKHTIGGAGAAPTGWLMQLQRCKTRMLVIDDTSALESMAPSTQANIFNTIRTAISRYDLNVLLIGTSKVSNYVRNDAQLDGRSQYIALQSFKAGDPALIDFLDAFQKWCPLQKDSDLCSDLRLRKALVHRSNGITRNIVDCLQSLTAYAIETSEEKITYGLWDEYYTRHTYNG